MSNDLKKYDEFFARNYERLKTYCLNYGIDEDVLNDVYLRLRDNVKEVGFEDRGYYTFIVTSIRNHFINTKKTPYLKKIVYLIDEHVFTETYLHNILEKNICVDNTERSQYITRKLFYYLQHELKINAFELMIFKIYFLSKQKMTYNVLNKMFNTTNNDIVYIIKKIKKDLKTNFIKWLEDEYRRDFSNNE